MKWKLILVCLASLLLIGATKESLRSSLVTIEGEVLDIGHQLGEGDVELLTVTLVSDQDGEPVALMLAPEGALEQLGFEIAVGDRLKAKVFPTAEGPAKVHKVKNLSHNTLLRLRTLHRIPLWNGAGVWQGGPGQGAMGCPEGHGPRRQEGSRPGG